MQLLCAFFCFYVPSVVKLNASNPECFIQGIVRNDECIMRNYMSNYMVIIC